MKLKIIAKLWSAVYDLLFYIDGKSNKSLDQIHNGKEVRTMDEYITRAEHAEFCARLDAENNRQNRRIEILEGTTKQISELTTSVQKLAMSVENMVKEQGRQGDRLEALENRDGEMWRKVTGYVLTTIIGIAIGFLAKQIGF